MSRTVRVGLISTSWWTDLMYVPSLNSHPAVRVAAVCGRSAERAGEVAGMFGGAKVFSDYRRMIDAGDLDAVIVAAPDDLHYPMTMAALDAGLHVLCEKPLANNAADARAMLDKAEAAGVKHMVLFTWRWQPHWRYVKHLVDTGFIGPCRHAEFQFLGDFAGESGYKWRFDGARANGITGDLGSHMIDFARWYLGEVTEVMADLSTFVDQSETATPAPTPVNDVGLLTLRFASGARAQIAASAVRRCGDETVRIVVTLNGEAGTIEVRHIFTGVRAGVTMRAVCAGDPSFVDLTVPAEFLEGGVDPRELFDPYVKQSAGPRAFIDAILTDARAEPGFDVGAGVQAVVDAALRSSTQRGWVSLAEGQAAS